MTLETIRANLSKIKLTRGFRLLAMATFIMVLVCFLAFDFLPGNKKKFSVNYWHSTCRRPAWVLMTLVSDGCDSENVIWALPTSYIPQGAQIDLCMRLPIHTVKSTEHPPGQIHQPVRLTTSSIPPTWRWHLPVSGHDTPNEFGHPSVPWFCTDCKPGSKTVGKVKLESMVGSSNFSWE